MIVAIYMLFSADCSDWIASYSDSQHDKTIIYIFKKHIMIMK